MNDNLTPEPLGETPIDGTNDPLSPALMPKSETMDFPDAIRELIAGKRIARIEWHNADYGVLRNGWLTIFRNGTFHTWTVNDGDLTSIDWQVLTDLN